MNRDLISSYLKYTERAESPTKYHLWSLFGTVAACVRRKVWLDWGFFTIYPNMFIILVGPPGARKTTAIRIATNLIEGNKHIHLSSDSITWQALIDGIKDSYAVDQIPNGQIVEHCSFTAISEELSVFIGKENYELLSVLTNLYDCKDKWEYRTRGRGIITLHNVWLNMLGATTPEWLSGSLPLSAIGGGFTSRIIFVVAEGPRLKAARPTLTDEEKQLKSDLKHLLNERVAKLGGEMGLTKEADKWFTDWYETKKEGFENDPRFSGYAARKHIHVIRLGMILSLCRTDDLIVEKDDLIMALTLIEDTEVKMQDAFGAIGRSEVAIDIGEVMEVMRTVVEISRRDLLRGVWRNVSPDKFDKAMGQLKDMGYVESIFKGGHLVYKLVKEKEGEK